MRKVRWFAALGLLLGANFAQAAELNIYSARQEALIKPQLDAFTAATGIKVNLVTGPAEGLVQRLKAEGAGSPADLFFTADAGNLGLAAQAGLFQKIDSAALNAAIPAPYRDSDGRWFGLGLRARPIFVVKGKVDPAAIKSYEDLADPKWKGKILVRSSTHIYNQSLLAALIETHGATKAEAWAAGVIANLARKPQGGDRDQLKAAAAGEGDIVIANSYYFAAMLGSSNADDKAVAEKFMVIWPNQGDRGTHVNVSGAGVTASSKNVAEATKLLEFLASADAQKIYAEIGQEFPVRANVARSAVLASLGTFKMDTLPLSVLGKHNAEAVKIFDRVGWR